MLLPVNQEMEVETYHLESARISQVTDWYGDLRATVIACQAMVAQVGALMSFVRKAMSEGSRYAGAVEIRCVEEDFEEIDSIVASLNGDRLRDERQALSESARLTLHEHVTLPVSNARTEYEDLLRELESHGAAERAEDDARLTERRVRVATPYVRAYSYFNAYRFLRERLGEEPDEATWLSIVKVMCLVNRQAEDALIEVVARAEHEAGEWRGFEAIVREEGRAMNHKTLAILEMWHDEALDRLNARLPLITSPSLEAERSVVDEARVTVVEPSGFAWGCRDRKRPGGKVELGEVFVLYIHDGRKLLQLLDEPYPDGFPAEKVIAHVDSIVETLADLMLEELPEWYVGEDVRVKMETIRQAAEQDIHTVAG